MDESDAASLRPLRAVAADRAALQDGPPDTEAARAAMLRVAESVDESLRRMLRDDPRAPLPLRLRALAHDEISSEELISELRQRDFVSIELAAAFHEMLGVRARLREGEPGTPRDAQRVLRAAQLLERDAMRPPPTLPAEPAVPAEDAVGPSTAATTAAGWRGVPLWAPLLAAVALLVVLAVGLWLRVGQPSDVELEEGIALFRSGELARAAPIFRDYADAHPRDATARLYLARIYRREGEPDSAAAELRHALDIAPEDAGVYRELGLLFLDLGEADAAIRPFRRAVELDPERSEGWIMLIQALQLAGQPGAAQRVRAQAPPEVRALLQEGAPAPQRPPPLR